MLNFFKIKLTSLLKDRSWVLEILPILLLGLLSFTWFRGNNFIGGGDFGMPMDWIKCLKSLTWSWNEDYSFGAHDPRSLTILIPYVLIGAFLQGLGISLVLIEKIIFYLLFVSGGLSMYYLCSALGIKKIGKIVASLFFMVNPFSLIIIWRVSHAFIQMPYAFAPLYLGLYINGLLKKKNYVYWLLVTLIWEFTSTSSYTWQAAVIIHWLPIGLYFIFFFFAFPKQRNYAIKSTLMLVFSWLLINAYWLLPFITSLSQAIASAHSPALMSDIDTLKLTSVKIFEAIRMMGFWSLHSGYRGEPYYPYHNYYNNFFVLSISWLIPVLVIFGLWKNWICKNKLIFFYSIALITFGLLGMSGPTLPFGNLIIGLYKLFPPLALLTRFTFLFFGIPAFLAFTYLIGEGVNFLWEKGEKKFSSFLYFPLGLLGFLLFVILVWPFWNGEVIRSGNNNYPGERFTVPSYWFDAKKWLAEEKDYFRILPLPMSKTYNVAQTWGEGYSGGDLLRWFTNKPPINVGTVPGFEVAGNFAENLEKQIDNYDYVKILGYLNAKYVLLRDDTRWQFIKGHNWWFYQQPEVIKKFLSGQKLLSLQKEIGELKFYKLEDKYLLPHFYLSQKVALIDGPIESLTDLASFLRPEEKEIFLFANDNVSLSPGIKEKLAKEDLVSQVFIWKKPTQTQEGISYTFKVESPGDYKIFLRKESIVDYYEAEKTFKWQLNGGEIKETPLSSSGSLLEMGKMALSPGDYTLKIILPAPINLIADPSFEVGSLGSDFYSEDAFRGKKSLKLVATNQNQLINLPVKKIKPGDSYLISLYGKSLQGVPPKLLIWENYTDKDIPNLNPPGGVFGEADPQTQYMINEMNLTNRWQRLQMVFKPNLFAKKIGLIFLTSPEEKNIFNLQGNSASLIDEVTMTRVFDNPLILRKEINQNLPQFSAEASFTKINPTKYIVNINEQNKTGVLVFSEAFHPGWLTSLKFDHLKVNGFANAWLITASENLKIQINYGPQKWFYLSISISVLVFVLILITIFLKRRKI